MTTDSYILIGTGFFTAIAAASAYLSVTKGAEWAARRLDAIDPIKQLMQGYKDRVNARTHNGHILLHTGEYIWVRAINHVGFGTITIAGSISDSSSSTFDFNAPMKIDAVSESISIRYSAIALAHFDEYPILQTGKDIGSVEL